MSLMIFHRLFSLSISFSVSIDKQIWIYENINYFRLSQKNLSHDQISLLLGFKLKFPTCIFICFTWMLPPPPPPPPNPGLGWQFTASSISYFQRRVLTDASHQLTARALCRCRKFKMRYEKI